MVLHPTLRTLSKFVDQQLSESQREKIGDHLNRCRSCKDRMHALKTMEPALCSKRPLTAAFKDAIVSNLKDVKRAETPSCAVVKEIIGKAAVYYGSPEEGVEVFPGMVIKRGDTIRTQGGTKALIRLNDGSCFYLNQETKIQFHQKGIAPVSLHRGQLFAMMKPQKRKFTVQTPAAVLGVIGTDFDTKVEDNRKTILTVLKGKVSFKNNSGETLVKKKHRVEAGRHSRPVATRIKEPELFTQWTRELRPPKRHGGTTMKKLFVGIFLLAALIGVIPYLQKMMQPPRPHVVRLSKTDPFQLMSPCAQENLAWRTQSHNETKQDGNWVKSSEIVTLTEVLEADPREGARVRFTIEQCASFDNNPANRKAAGQLVGRQFEYYVSPQGRIDSFRAIDGKPLEGSELGLFLTSFTATDMISISSFPKRSAAPGEQWSALWDIPPLGLPNCFVQGDTTVKFTGYERHGGVEVAVFVDQYEGAVGGGFPVETLHPAPAVTVFVECDHFDVQGVCKYIVETQSGRVVRSEETGTVGGQKLTIRRVVPGRPVKQEKVESDQVLEYRNSHRIEYL